MTPKEADQRIVLSAKTLTRYRQVGDELHWPVADRQLFDAEIEMLSAIVDQHLEKVEQVGERLH